MRDKFLSRLFGLFSEEVVRAWAADERAPYEDLGRPTLRWPGDRAWHTIDFTLRRRSDGAVFASEMKCELEYEGYRYLRLTDVAHVARHRGSMAFQKFLAVSTDPRTVEVSLKGRPIEVDGGILVWGAVAAEAVEPVQATSGFADVLTVESVVRDLHQWRRSEWLERVSELRRWSGELFDWLAGDARGDGVSAEPSESPVVSEGSR